MFQPEGDVSRWTDTSPLFCYYQLKNINCLPPVGTVQPVVKRGSLRVATLPEERSRSDIAFWHKSIELVNAQMRRDIPRKQTKRFGGKALSLLLRHNDDSNLCPMMQRVIALQVNEAHANAIGLLNDKTELAVMEEIIGALSNKLSQSIVGERHRSLSTRPKLRVVLDEIHQVEVLGFHRSQFQLVTL